MAYLVLSVAFGIVLFLVAGNPAPTVPTVALTGLAALATVVLGVVNAVLDERSRSVWPSVVAHGTNDAIIVGLTALLAG